jgi:vacuolar-type H+-ATPase subunit H
LPPLGELLRRFRFLGVPGAPASAAVPVDRRAVRAAELAPVLAALHGAETEAAAIVARAELEAAHRREAAAARADSIVAEARTRAKAVRAEATEARLADARARSRRVVDDARREVARLERRMAARRPAVVGELVARVLDSGREPA